MLLISCLLLFYHTFAVQVQISPQTCGSSLAQFKPQHPLSDRDFFSFSQCTSACLQTFPPSTWGDYQHLLPFFIINHPISCKWVWLCLPMLFVQSYLFTCLWLCYQGYSKSSTLLGTYSQRDHNSLLLMCRNYLIMHHGSYENIVGLDNSSFLNNQII